MAYHEKGDLDRAISDFNQAIIIDPNHEWAYYNRGITYATKGENANAIADFKKVLEYCDKNPELCQKAQDMIKQLEGG